MTRTEIRSFGNHHAVAYSVGTVDRNASKDGSPVPAEKNDPAYENRRSALDAESFGFFGVSPARVLSENHIRTY
jgi:hypothetical protein